MTSLADQIANLTNPTPNTDDPEDIDDATAAKLTKSRPYEDDDDDLTTNTPSSLRRHAAPLLTAHDAKYAGKRTSRQQLNKSGSTLFAANSNNVVDSDKEEEDESDDGDTDADSGDEVMDSDVGHSGSDAEEDFIQSDNDEEDLAGFKESLRFQDTSHRNGTSPFLVTEADEDSDEDVSDDDEDSEDESSESEEGSGEEEEGVQQFSRVNIEDEIQKGKAVRSQLGIWDSLLEERIKMQKILLSANQLPPPEIWTEFVTDIPAEYQADLQQAGECLQKVLKKLVDLQTSLLLCNPETQHVADPGASKHKKDAPEDDEEITSDSEQSEASESETNQSENLQQNLKRKIKMADYPEFIAKRHKNFQSFRDSTIQKWYDKTKVSSGRLSKGFSAFEQSALKQIEQIMSDKTRLIRRTQLKRSSVHQLFTDHTEKAVEESQNELTPKEHIKDYDEEIFDDDDFYHQLLRELIERKTCDTNDPIALSRQWLEIQKLRSKSKKKVDTRASKGRKIRYNVHQKLVNFMAPVNRYQWTNEAQDELYKCLFGRQHTTQEHAQRSSRADRPLVYTYDTHTDSETVSSG